MPPEVPAQGTVQIAAKNILYAPRTRLFCFPTRAESKLAVP